jgi:hypothetical protein
MESCRQVVRHMPWSELWNIEQAANDGLPVKLNWLPGLNHNLNQ